MVDIKKIIALLFAFILLISLFPISAQAQSESVKRTVTADLVCTNGEVAGSITYIYSHHGKLKGIIRFDSTFFESLSPGYIIKDVTGYYSILDYSPGTADSQTGVFSTDINDVIHDGKGVLMSKLDINDNLQTANIIEISLYKAEINIISGAGANVSTEVHSDALVPLK